MSISKHRRRTISVIAALVPIALLFLWVAIRSGPFATVAVTVGTVEPRAITPILYGIGTTEARYTYRIGPTFAGRLKSLRVDVGDKVEAGELLGEMDPVDLGDRIAAQEASIEQAEAALRKAEAEQAFAATQAERYEKLRQPQAVSEELVQIKQKELKLANEGLESARREVSRLRSGLEALHTQREHLRLTAPVGGIVIAREMEPGSTVIAGQPVVELIDPVHLWVNARFDQISAQGLGPGLSVKIKLRSRPDREFSGHILRIEPRADAVTEEILAKAVFDPLPDALPPLGELAEITVQLEQLPESPAVPNAAIHTRDGIRGVWKPLDNKVVFAPLRFGRFDPEGFTQVTEGLAVGDDFVLYSEKPLSSVSRVRVVGEIFQAVP